MRPNSHETEEQGLEQTKAQLEDLLKIGQPLPSKSSRAFHIALIVSCILSAGLGAYLVTSYLVGGGNARSSPATPIHIRDAGTGWIRPGL